MSKPHKHRGDTLLESARSIEIKCGEFLWSYEGPVVENCDELGGGWETWGIYEREYESGLEANLIAWMLVEEMPLPDFYEFPY